MPSRIPPKLRSARYQTWTYVAINLLAFPGLGTVMAGRRIGYVQATLMVGGFILVLGYFGWTMAGLYQLSMSGDEVAWRHHFRTGIWAGLGGFALCLVAWVSALLSSIRMLRNQPPQPAGDCR